MTKFLRAILVASPVLLGACTTAGSSSLDTGQRLSQRGGEISTYGKAWSDGQKDYRQGQRMVERSGKASTDGEKQLARAREQVAEAEEHIRSARAERSSGEQLMTDGTARMQRAEASYTAARTGPPATGGN